MKHVSAGLFCCGLLFVLSLAAPSTARAGEEGTNDVPSLLEDLKSDDAAVRQEAAEQLGELGAAARSALPALTKVARGDAEEDVRAAAKESVAKIKAAVARKPRTQPRKENSLVGSWHGTCATGGLAIDMTITLNADGSYFILGTNGNIVAADRGTYTYADGVLTCTPGTGGKMEQSTITWNGPNEYVSRGSGVAITWHRQ